MTTAELLRSSHSASVQRSGQPSGAALAVQADDALLRDVFRRRAAHAVERLAASASLESLALALEAPTDFGTIASALGHAGMPASALDLDPLADAVARGAAAKASLAEQAGGLLSTPDAGRALGITRQAVDKRRRANQLLAVKVASDWRYPAMQIGSDGQVPPYLAAILTDGAAASLTGWAMLDFLLAPDTVLGGLSPWQALRQGCAQPAEIGRILAASAASAFG
jgi:hypothetical protein